MAGYSSYVSSLFSSNNAQSPAQPPQSQYSRPNYTSSQQTRPAYNSYNQSQSAYNTPQVSTPNYPTSAQPTNTTNATSSWTSSLSSRFATLRKGLASFSNNETDDPDYEDSSHISGILRAYYTEKGRPFPPWLPPDPKDPTPVPVPALSQQASYGNYGGYNTQSQQHQNPYGAPARPGAGLGDLFGTNPTPSQPAAPSSQSLRRGPGRPVPQSLSSSTSIASTQSNQDPPTSARPLPSQRAGSVQQGASVGTGLGGTRDRLRARLQGGGASGRSSPVAGQMSQSSQPSQTSQTSTATGGGGGGYGSNPYGVSSGAGARSGDGNPYGTTAGGSAPYLSSSQPWSTGGSDEQMYGGYGGGGTGGGAGAGGGYGGAPSPNPPGRKPPGGGVGLPSGPRLRPGGPR